MFGYHSAVERKGQKKTFVVNRFFDAVLAQTSRNWKFVGQEEKKHLAQSPKMLGPREKFSFSPALLVVFALILPVRETESFLGPPGLLASAAKPAAG